MSEAAVSRLPGLALGDSLELSQQFSKSVASERYLKSECELEGSARCGREAAARGQLPMFRLKPTPLKRVDDSAFEGPGRLFWACVQGRLSEVKRGMERGLCNTGQISQSVYFVRQCAGELPTIPFPTRTQPGFCTTISCLAGSAALNLSTLK